MPTNLLDLEETYYQKQPVEIPTPPSGETLKKPLGDIFGTRSGDKGGCANLGVWTKTEEIYSFVYHYLTVDQLKSLLPDLDKYDIERYELPNINSLNFYIKDILEDGASSNTKVDALAKSLGEYLRSKHVNVPKKLMGGVDD